MSLGVSESRDIEVIDFVDNKYIFYPDNGTLVDGCWQKFKFHQNAWFPKKNCFPCWNWPTEVEHSQQYAYNVWFKHILHIHNGYSYRVLTFIRIFVRELTCVFNQIVRKSWICMRLQSDRSERSQVRWQWAWVFRNRETLNLSILLTINRLSFGIIFPWWTVVDKNSKLVKIHIT